MVSNKQIMPGVAAIVLAVLFPLYWITVLFMGSGNYGDIYRNDLLTLSWMDALFIVVGVLEIYIYLSLRRALSSQLGSAAPKAMLLIMVGTVALFHALVGIDVFLAIDGGQLSETALGNIVGISVGISIASLIIHAIAGLILGGLLLLKGGETLTLLKIFAILLVVGCLFDLTIIFAPVNILLFPAASLVLAVYFLKDSDMIEVV